MAARPDAREPLAPTGVQADGEIDGRRADALLVERAASGDARAFEDIVRTHGSLVLGLGRRLLGNGADAEDLLQDVFMRVHRALPSFRGDASLRTWIARVTVNAARNRRRDDGRRGLRAAASLDAPVAPGSDTTVGDFVSDPAPGPERLLASREARERLERALEQVPAEFREAVLLRDAEGLSYEEIAEALGVSIGTVKSRIARGRARLHALLPDLTSPEAPA